jgi:hypothetical protein
MTQPFAIMSEDPGPRSETRTEPAVNEVRLIPIAAIKVDPAIQQRVNGTSQRVVEEYAQAMRDGAKFPPLVVFCDGTDYHLGDGFHRAAAHGLAHPDLQEIECEVHPGGNREDAIVFACGANAGLRRGPRDLRKAVTSLLGIHPELPDRKIARLCKVSPTLVAKVRKKHLQTTFIDAAQNEGRPKETPTANEGEKPEATAVPPDRQRIVVRNGKQYPMKIDNIGACRTKPNRSKANPRTTKALRTNANGARPSRRKKPEPFLTASAWSMSTKLERVKFIKEVGWLELVDALRENEPGLNLMNRVWESTGQEERQAFVNEHHEEINALANSTRSAPP